MHKKLNPSLIFFISFSTKIFLLKKYSSKEIHIQKKLKSELYSLPNNFPGYLDTWRAETVEPWKGGIHLLEVLARSSRRAQRSREFRRFLYKSARKKKSEGFSWAQAALDLLGSAWCCMLGHATPDILQTRSSLTRPRACVRECVSRS